MEFSTDLLPVCFVCGGRPGVLAEYVEAAAELGLPPDDYVKREEATYNPKSGKFCCTTCYMLIGCPTSPCGWKAP